MMKILKYLIFLVLMFGYVKAEYTWKKIEKIDVFYRRVFVEDSLGNIYFQADTSLYKSIDEGETWYKIFSRYGGIYDLIATNSNSIYFEMFDYSSENDSILYSNDFGNYFNNLTQNRPFPLDTIKASSSLYYTYSINIKGDSLIVSRIISYIDSVGIARSIGTFFYRVEPNGDWVKYKYSNDSIISYFNLINSFVDMIGNFYCESNDYIYYLNFLTCSN